MTASCAFPCHLFRLRTAIAAALGLLGTGPVLAQFESSSNSSSQSERYISQATPQPIFFPPNPPPLGRLVSRLSTTGTGLTFAPPPELATFITEPFYAPLSTRLMRKTLDEKKRSKLNAYRTYRDALLEELQVALTHLREAEPAARRSGLLALAQRQSARLVELEAIAEQIRAELATSDTDWSALREWRIGERNVRGDSPVELGAVIRAYAFYQPGLLPGQRQLLREIVIELTSGAEDAAAAAAQQPFLFFSPALTRVRLPDSLPDDVAAKVAAFETKRSSLKKELFDTVLVQDHATFAFTRNAAIRSLAARQETRLAEIERLADEIRDGLVGVPFDDAREQRSPLPPGLTQRTMEAVEARTALHRTSRAKIDAILGELPESFPVVFVTMLDATGVKVRMVPRGTGRLWPNDPRLLTIMTKLNEVGADHRQRNEELSRSIDDLKGDVGRVLGSGATPKAINDAIDAVIRYNVQRENDDGYRDYRIAVFEPGLSPEQRRLLLGAAVRKLDLPLPDGELQPTRRPAMW